MPKGRPSKNKEGPAEKKLRRDGNCIVHCTSKEDTSFTFLNEVDDPDKQFERLLNIKELRLAEPHGSSKRMSEVCANLPEMRGKDDGYHRSCYQAFTKNIDRLSAFKSKSLENVCDVNKRMTRTSVNTSSDKILFAPDCIFCNKEGRKAVKKGGVWTTESTKNFEKGGGKSVQEQAKTINDAKLLLRIRDKDLFAVEAKYHPYCRKQYMQNPEYWRSNDHEQVKQQEELQVAHQTAFISVCRFIEEEIIQKKKMYTLVKLNNMYIAELEKTNFPNPNHRSSKLKEKLESSDMKDKLGFSHLDKGGTTCSAYIVYNSGITVELAIKGAYELGSRDHIIEVAMYLRRAILEAFKTSADMQWPPNPHTLANTHVKDIVPLDLLKLMCTLLSGQPSIDEMSPKLHRLVSSITQDICRASTDGKWKMPKHILICMTIRHMFRSAELTRLLNRFGHSENYDFSLELETAIGKAVDQVSHLLTNQIIRSPSTPSVFTSDWDNFDQFVNKLVGSGIINTAHGIMLQELIGAIEMSPGNADDLPQVPRLSEWSFNMHTRDDLPECFIPIKKKGPAIVINQECYPEGQNVVDISMKRFLLWMMLRVMCSGSTQIFPGWSGFISITGKVPERLTTIDYYPVILHPITEYSTVQECLRYCAEATKEVGQKYVISCFDLGVCMKAFPLVWQDPIKYDNHIILIGTFHLCMAYFKVIGKKMKGSGWIEILLEARLITTDSSKGVENGKNYERSMNCHKCLLEGLERLLMERFLDGNAVFAVLDEQAKQLLQVFKEGPSEALLDELMQNRSIVEYIDSYIQFRDLVRKGKLGKTAKFWISYMDNVWLALNLQESIKRNNFVQYAHSMYLMTNLFFSYDAQNYARYMSYFVMFLANIDWSHPGAGELLKLGAFSVARSFVPGSRCAVDKTIEETFMKHAKSRGGAGGSGIGLSGITRNYKAYQRWARTTHERTKYLYATLGLAGMITDSTDTHKDLRPTEIKRGESFVEKVKEAIQCFSNPFEIDSNMMHNVVSGAPVPAEIEYDLLHAEEIGRKSMDEFVETRLKIDVSHERQLDFFCPIKRKNLKTMCNMTKMVRLKSSQNKTVEYRNQRNIAFKLLIKCQELDVKVDLKEVMKYSLTPVPYSLATADGFPAKTDKSKGFAYLTKNIESLDASELLCVDVTIEDGNALFYYMKQLPETFFEISERIYDICARGDVIFSTDTYVKDSIKSMERKRRGESEKFVVSGAKTRRPGDWNTFLKNDENKQQLIALLFKVWTSKEFANKIDRKVIFIKEGEAFLIEKGEMNDTEVTEIEALKSDQEETDTRIILYTLYASKKGYKTVRVKSPDTDVFFILIAHALNIDSRVLFDTGHGNKRRLLDITKLANEYGQELCSALLGLHEFTGADSTSAIRGKGKIRPLKLMLANKEFISIFAQLGEAWEISETLMQGLERFMCSLYGFNKESDINTARYLKLVAKAKSENGDLKKGANFDLACAPPCRSVLLQHAKRANYQTRICKLAHVAIQEVPSPCEHGWKRTNENLGPLWSEDDIMPVSLVDLLEEGIEDEDRESDEEFIQSDEENETSEIDFGGESEDDE